MNDSSKTKTSKCLFLKQKMTRKWFMLRHFKLERKIVTIKGSGQGPSESSEKRVVIRSLYFLAR